METHIPRFDLGQKVITQNAQYELSPEDVVKAIARHILGDWGDVGPEDRQANDAALREGGRLFSVYHDQDGTKFYIITESDRSATTILLPEDY